VRRHWEPCPLCGSVRVDEVYRARQFTGSFGGILETRLDMCRACDFVFSNPRPDEASLSRFYDADPNASGQVYRRAGPGSSTALLAAARVDYIRRHAPATRSLLDMGCGRGDFLHAAAAATTWRLSGIDPSSAAVARTRGLGLDILRATLDEAVAVVRPHDAVTLNGVLEHLREPVPFLARLASLLTPGGRLFLEVPDTTRPVASLVEFFDFEHLGHFTVATLDRMLARAGWRLLDRDPEHGEQGRLVVCAGRADDPTATAAPDIDHAAEREAVLAAIARYRDEKVALEERFRARLLPALDRWRRRRARVAVYGAGLHTDYLLGCCPELEPAVTCLLDSDPAKHGRDKDGWRIHGPAEIPDLGLDAIVISSLSGEADILDSLAAMDCGGAEIVPCYGRAPEPKPRRSAAAAGRAVVDPRPRKPGRATP